MVTEFQKQFEGAKSSIKTYIQIYIALLLTVPYMLQPDKIFMLHTQSRIRKTFNILSMFISFKQCLLLSSSLSFKEHTLYWVLGYWLFKFSVLIRSFYMDINSSHHMHLLLASLTLRWKGGGGLNTFFIQCLSLTYLMLTLHCNYFEFVLENFIHFSQLKLYDLW